MLGGLLAFWWPRVIWVHIPAAIWGVAIEFGGWICPLTPLEQHLRQQQGEAGYQRDFIAHYILPLLYPDGLTRRDQVFLGGVALTLNIVVYALVFLRRRNRRERHMI